MSTKKFVPQYMHKWELSGWDNNYGGEDLSDWYILIARTRDSDILENSNFESIKRDLLSDGFEICSDVDEYKCILLASFGHWACGWIESLMIHQSNYKALQRGDEIKEALDDYPIYDESDYSDRECNLIWDSVREYYVEDYLRDNNLEYTDQMLDDLTSELVNNDDIQWEVESGSDSVIPYIHSVNYDKRREFINDLLADMTDEYPHLKTCPTCHVTFNPDKTACKCQMKLFTLEDK